MKKKIKTISIILIIVQIISIVINLNISNAVLIEGQDLMLRGDHECDSVLEYWMEEYNRWSYKIVWYVYYIDSQTGERYPAFCVEPAKEGVGTGYSDYNSKISREYDNGIWRILAKGYMGSNYSKWNLECDDDLYSATKVALHSYVQKVAPKEKYILGNRSVDGNTVEEIQRRGTKVLEVAQSLYEYGINGKDVYQEPKVNISKYQENKTEEINGIEYYTQKYKVSANKELKSYEIQINNFVEGTKILNLNNQEILSQSGSYFKIAIPIKNIKENIEGTIYIKNAQIKTCPIYYCKSYIENAQSYVTYIAGYETTETSINEVVDPNNSTLIITKIDEETKQVIPNVEFKISNEQNEEIGRYKTNEEGIIKIENLKPGIVKIKEIKVDEKYVLNSEELQIELQWGKTSEIQIENEKIKGQIKIIKTSKDDNQITGEKAGSPISNVTFQIKDEKGKVVETLTTNEQGEALSKNLEKGKYIVKEIKANENYELDETEYTVEIQEHEQIIILQITNKSKMKLPRTGF